MNNHPKKGHDAKGFTGIVVALPRELKTLGYHKKTEKGIICHSGQVSIFLSGIGKGNAIYAAEQLIQNGATCLISWGTAAALAPEIRTGTLLIPEQVITEDQKQISAGRLRNDLIEQLSSTNRAIHYGPLCATAEVIAHSEQKSALMQRTGAISTDMESGAIAETAQKNGLPFVVIRAVSDSSKMVVPKAILQNTNSDGFADEPKIIKQALFSPKDWLPMVRLYYNFRKAQKNLQEVAHILLPYLSQTNQFIKGTFVKG